jgi:hypothetical protein
MEQVKNEKIDELMVALNAMHDRTNFARDVQAALRELISLRKREEWIKVSDRLPEKPDHYLCWLVDTCCRDNYIPHGAAIYWSGKWEVMDEPDDVLHCAITHWKPLDAPTKD